MTIVAAELFLRRGVYGGRLAGRGCRGRRSSGRVVVYCSGEGVSGVGGGVFGQSFGFGEKSGCKHMVSVCSK